MTPRTVLLACLPALLASSVAAAANSGSGHFRMGENRQEYRHAYAVARDSFAQPGMREVMVFLTSHPVDLAGAPTSFDLDSLVGDQLREPGGSLVRVTLPATKDDGPGMWFSSNEPSDSFNSSGSGEFSMTENTASRVAGRWVMAEPDDFFDKTWDFDLVFAADVVDANPRGDALAAGGGEPGAAYLAEVKAVAAGDADFFRATMDPSMAAWLLPADNADEVKSFFESRRWGTPKEATVSGGVLMGDAAVLRVAGVNYEGQKLAGAVMMRRGERGWEQENSSLAVQWE